MKILIFIGPDGAGKSTIITNITRILFENMPYQVIHFKPFIFQRKKGPNQTPYAKKPYGFFLSLARFILWLAEYYLWWVYSYFFHNQTVYIFDRFLYDVNIDPLRYRVNKWISKIPYFYLLYPGSKIVFLLQATAANLQLRKQEVTEDQSKIQMENYLKYFKTKKNSYFIDTNKSLKDTLDEIKTIYYEKI